MSILWPDRASGFPRAAGEEILQKLERARIVPVPDCGILAALEAPALLTSIIAAELDGDFRLEGAA